MPGRFGRLDLRWLVGLIAAAVWVASPARAQTMQAADTGPRFYLMTIGPGDEAYELFGHNALVVKFGGQEVAFNWGMFDFKQESFVWRFVQGRMLYSMGGLSLADSLEEYTANHRATTIRERNLSPAQRRKLLDLCIANDTPATRDYRYDYYRDNCSTRVRDIIDAGTGGQVAAALKGVGAGSVQGWPVTYRFHTDRLTQRSLWLYPTLHYVMGHPIDRQLDLWEQAFLPLKLEESLIPLRVTWEDGSVHPLLGSAQVAVPNTRGPEPVTPPRWWMWFLAVGLVWGGAVAKLGWSRAGWARRTASVGIIVWSGLCVLAGTVSTYTWLFTDHAVARSNENWLQLNPLSLPVMWAGILLLFGRKRKWMMWAAALVAGLSFLGWLIKLVPGMIQPNVSILLLATPIHIGVLAAVWKMGRRPV